MKNRFLSIAATIATIATIGTAGTVSTVSTVSTVGAVVTVAALSALSAVVALPAAAQFTPPQPSPGAKVSQVVGASEVAVSYSRPSVKGRVIWGELVPWDKPWRAGANDATTVSFSDEVLVDGQKLDAGTYSLGVTPGKESWTVAFGRDASAVASYTWDDRLVALAVKVKPTSGENQESLRYSFENVTPDSAQLVLAWEKVRLSLALKFDTKAIALRKARAAAAAAKGDDWQTPLSVARWMSNEKLDGAEALAWVDKSIAAKKTVGNTGWKARILAQSGKTADAIKVGEESVALAKADPAKPNTEALEKLIAEWKAKK